MNASVIRLAIRTASLIHLFFKFDAHRSLFLNISEYFGEMGLSAGEIKKCIHDTQIIFPADVQKLQESQTTGLVTEMICAEINRTLGDDEKIFLLLLVQDYLVNFSEMSGYQDMLENICNNTGIDGTLIEKFSEFVGSDEPDAFLEGDCLILSPPRERKDEKLEGSWIEDIAPKDQKVFNILEMDGVHEHLIITFVDQIKSFLIRGLNGSSIKPHKDHDHNYRFRILQPGSEFHLKGGIVLTYTQIKEQYLQLQPKGSISLVARDIRFSSPKGGTRSISRFTVSEVSGRLIGVVGKEGVGKSTLLKLLAGHFKPDEGKVIINGYDLWRYKYLLKGIIGYVPEEDLLFEELTVYENLILTARLHYSNLSKKDIENKVDALLKKLDLLELKHEIVGDIFSKRLQPGQRRMLNIALELLREPQILLVDDALYGLGMADASKVIRILHDYTFEGNLVITTISQAGSHTFKYFDKIWILDEGGRMVYNGSIQAATAYLYRHLNLVTREIRDIDPSILLDLINYKLPEPEGAGWKRFIEPQRWHSLYFEENVPDAGSLPEKAILPARILKIPNLEVQLLIFSIRNFKCKFSRLRDILIAFLSGPILGAAIAILLRMSHQGDYSYSSNANIPIFQFLSVLTVMVMGMITSADEFIRERNILKKEEYLELSRFSYINSKILFLFPLIAIQTFLYVIVSNYILEIKEMTWYYWFVLFSAGCFGVVAGLFFSMSVRKSGIIYEKIIPVVIALQIILGGGIIPYDRLNLGSGKYSPVLADLMVSRWGYEALVVTQYKNNKYGTLFFDVEKELSYASFYSEQLVPALEEMLNKCISTNEPVDSSKIYCDMLYHELSKVEALPDIFPFEYLNSISDLKDNEMVIQEVSDYLTYLSIYFYDACERSVYKKDSLMVQLEKSMGTGGLEQLRNDYHNQEIEETVRRTGQNGSFVILDREIVPRVDPIFMAPESEFGRAGFFSATKFINGQFTSTIWFNISVIWIFTFLFYLLLLFDTANIIRRFIGGNPV
ncbi:MAG: ATP-binding cassette domain-containing protein [Bacteroidales bacterium]|nr:ATP-binding cassette domain-containing protein [Bacteroidales bacterium]